MKNRQGVTLIELILVLALVGIVIPIIFSPIIFSHNNFDIQHEKTNIISDARAAMDYLTREIRKSDHIEIKNNTIIMDSDMYQLEDGILYKNDQAVMEGIDELVIHEGDHAINIEVIIKDSRSKEYKLSSTIHMR